MHVCLVCAQDSTRFEKTMALVRKYDPDEAARAAQTAAEELAKQSAAANGEALRACMPAMHAEGRSCLWCECCVHAVSESTAPRLLGQGRAMKATGAFLSAVPGVL